MPKLTSKVKASHAHVMHACIFLSLMSFNIYADLKYTVLLCVFLKLLFMTVEYLFSEDDEHSQAGMPPPKCINYYSRMQGILAQRIEPHSRCAPAYRKAS